jgi:predicted nuclease with RNAse H fold
VVLFPDASAGPVCGIDLGSLRTPAYVAWLLGPAVVLDMYQPTREAPLPVPPPGWPPPRCLAVDAPQGLPSRGRAARACDLAAGAPTRRLPRDRAELASWRAFGPLVLAGVELFWAVYRGGLGQVPGLAAAAGGPVVAETYPRYVLRRLWPQLGTVPSKVRAPLAYVDLVWPLLRAAGFRCPGVARPCVDHVDAMLCALAALAVARHGGLPPGTVGQPPAPDPEESLLREGYIVGP